MQSSQQQSPSQQAAPASPRSAIEHVSLESPRTTFLTPTSGSGLKQRIRELESIIDSELKSLHREVHVYRNQKVVQTSTCETLVEDTKKDLVDHLERSKMELKQFFVQQRSENLRLHDLIKTLRNENALLQQSQLQLQRRLQALEEDLGQ
ncbi:hypothetical protein TGGT1_224905 [Toxoplasma gondii GT1]|uniref:Uncharacterized protein n=2 Tax=Toxoplasma gondii TaxID=5811 RepID=S7W530_TOXGG|nr:hypothetical protein TGGT1_224905 [Toxoplasma gondii GT1]KAF4640530.1 hypothetical protein TGRH88_044560 [Toxoplasma gondii]